MQVKSILKNKYIHIVFFCMLFAFIVASRRWQQFVLPQVWDEDGTQIIPKFIQHGWLSLFEPVNGYLVTVPKIINAVALSLSFTNYPIISTLLAWTFIIFVGLMIALSPTQLKGRFFCALAIVLIPTDPEVFIAPLYTFWWASILLFVLVFWDEKRIALWWRLILLALGGLSSPIIVMLLPLFYIRVFIYKKITAEKILAICATLIAIVQLSFAVKSVDSHTSSVFSILANFIPVFFGNFIVAHLDGQAFDRWLFGLVLFIIILWWLFQQRRNLVAWGLAYILFGAIALTVVRVDILIIHPQFAGPRYFFYPFILLSWILIQVFCQTQFNFYKYVLGIIGVVALLNMFAVWTRYHDDLHWAQHVESCQFFPSAYSFPIQYDGNAKLAWRTELAGQTCASMTKKSIFNSTDNHNQPLFAYSAVKSKDIRPSDVRGDVVFDGVMNGTPYHVLGSVQTTDANVGDIQLQLKRGSLVYYASGGGKNQSMSIQGSETIFSDQLPNDSGWLLLDFSNTKLPDAFTLIIKDGSADKGEWSAVAVKS